MKIGTYNLLKGGKQRVHWVKMIEDHGVDLLLLQESYAHDEHLSPLVYPGTRNQSAWEMAERNGWGSAVFSSSGWVKRLQSCSVLAGDEWNRLSDHNPVLACFS